MASNNPTVTELLREYLDLVEAEDYEKLMDMFADEVVYRHPPNFGETHKVEGKENLLEYFQNERGAKDIDHEFIEEVNDGNQGATVGRASGEVVDDDIFVNYARVNDDNEIVHYVGALLIRNDLR